MQNYKNVFNRAYKKGVLYLMAQRQSDIDFFQTFHLESYFFPIFCTNKYIIS